MAEQHVKLFQAMGVPEAAIQEIEALTPEQLKEWKPEATLQTVKGLYENTFLNDNDFLNRIPEEKIPETVKKKIESGQYTRFQKELLETATKQLGLQETDLADLTEEDKKSIKKTVVKIAEKHLSKKGNVQGLQDMQKQITDLTTQLEARDADWQTKMNAELEKTNGVSNTKVIKALLRADLAGLDGLKFGVPVGYVADPVLNTLTSRYSISLNANDELTLMQKENPNLAVLKDGKPLTFQQALKDTVVEMKLAEIIDPKQQTKGKTQKIIVGGEEGAEGTVEMPDYIANKINKNKELENK